MTTHLDLVVREVKAVAIAEAERAKKLMEYANSLTGGEADMDVALADQFAGPMLATDILTKVEEFTRPVTPWSVHRAVAVALSNAAAGRDPVSHV